MIHQDWDRSESDVRLWRRFRQPSAAGDNPCLSDQQLAAYLDGQMTAAEAVAVERHLLACRACLSAVGELRELLAAGQPAMLAPAEVVQAASALAPAPPAGASAGRRSAAARPGVLWRLTRWAATAAAGVALAYAGYQTGGATWQYRDARDAAAVSEASLGSADASAADQPDNWVLDGGAQ